MYSSRRSQPTPQKVAWIVTVAASLLLLSLALWQSEMLLRQRKTAQTLEHRLRGVGQIVDQLEEAQSDPDFAAKYRFAPIPQMRSALSRSGSPALKRRYNRKICAMKQAISRPAWKM